LVVSRRDLRGSLDGVAVQAEEVVPVSWLAVLGVEGLSVSHEVNGEVNWVEIDVDKDAEDLDHLISPEERLRLITALQ
jgi:hypothetical protein